MSIRGRLARLLLGRTKRLVVPPQFNRNSPKVTAIMTPEQSGRWLLERMREQIGLASYDGVALLDFGCGVRFSQAILNTGLHIGSYTGVDNSADLIRFLDGAVRDERFTFVFLDAHHAMYNPGGRRTQTRLPLEEGAYDVASMFSVITHQDPEQTTDILTMLRRYVKSDGALFFTCFLDQSIATFEDRSPPGMQGERCFYNPAYLRTLIERSGWRVVRHAPGEAPLIGDSFVCRPA